MRFPKPINDIILPFCPKVKCPPRRLHRLPNEKQNFRPVRYPFRNFFTLFGTLDFGVFQTYSDRFFRIFTEERIIITIRKTQLLRFSRSKSPPNIRWNFFFYGQIGQCKNQRKTLFLARFVPLLGFEFDVFNVILCQEELITTVFAYNLYFVGRPFLWEEQLYNKK